MRVSALKASARRPGFVSVFIDGARFALLPIEEVRALGLERDGVLDERQRDALDTAAERQRAYDAAVGLLAVRGRSGQEVVQRLRRKGLRADAVDHAVGRLESEGLLDDASFAREFARSRSARGYGPARILAELSQKGVARRVSELAVAELGLDDWERRGEILRALALGRASQLRGLDRSVARRRLVGYLSRRGYPAADVWTIVDEVLGADAEETDA